MRSRKKVIIFGASGGIGKYLVDYLLENVGYDFELVGVGRRPCEFVAKRIAYIQMDISNREDFAKLPTDADIVIDLAGAMPARMKGYYPETYVNSNIIGTFNILEYCIANNIDRLLYTQSFGDIKDRSEESLVLTPDMLPSFSYSTDHSLYVVSKNTAVEMLKCYHGLHGLKVFIFRLPTVYSWSDDDSYYVDGVLRRRAWRILIDQATHGEPIEVWGDASRLKDMVYVKDFCQMIYRACFADRVFGHYNVGTGVGTSLLDQIRGMVEVFAKDKKSEIVFRPDKPNAPQYIMDISNAKDELGYEPKFNYIDMLEDMKKERDLDRF